MSEYHIGGGEGVGPGEPLGVMTEGLGFPLRPVHPTGVVVVGARPTEDAGNGTVADDVNNTDFTSQAGTTYLPISSNMVVTFVHKSVAYNYVGPTGVTVGIGGDYVTLDEDYVAIGTGDHSIMSNRDQADAHPMAAITGLEDAQLAQDQALTDHEAAADPHPVYPLETDCLDTFVMAGYGGIDLGNPVALPDITLLYQTLPFDMAALATPRFVTQDIAQEGLRFARPGIWSISVNFALEHDSSNSGRTFRARLTNVDKGTSSDGVVIGIGRNSEATNFGAALLAEVASANLGDLYVIEVGAASATISNVDLESGSFTTFQVGTAATIESGGGISTIPPDGSSIQNLEVDDFDNDGDLDIRVTID